MRKIITVVLLLLSSLIVSCDNLDYSINTRVDNEVLIIEVDSNIEVSKQNYSKIVDKIVENKKEEISQYELVHIYYNQKLISCIQEGKVFYQRH